MNNPIVFQALRWLLIILVQVLILNQIELSRFVSPYIYPLFILLLPLDTPIWAVLLMCFGTGLVVDTFGNSLGLHTAATVFMGYVRNYIMGLKKPSGDYADDNKDDLDSLGMRYFLVYAATCILVHHFIYFLLEMFSFAHLPYVFIKTIASATLSMAIIMLSRYLFMRRY